jgi:hypothetical protein
MLLTSFDGVVFQTKSPCVYVPLTGADAEYSSLRPNVLLRIATDADIWFEEFVSAGVIDKMLFWTDPFDSVAPLKIAASCQSKNIFSDI